ncbi:hypothetical protein ABEB36_011852 [Hypothenemus hampei]|uniref:Signal transducer and activator of transcription n=1 Tax=Hypothenemus hampei TaxID=57062 RepID=A0ABD1EA20_HYPHA
MALWAKARQLPQYSVHLQELRAIYGEHFPIEVRSVLAHFIEENFWLNPEPQRCMTGHDQYIANLINQLIQEIENKAECSNDASEYYFGKLKLAEAAKMFRQRYSSNPIQLFNLIRRCLEMEVKCLEAAGVDLLGVIPMLPVKNSVDEIKQKIEELKRQIQEMAEDTNQLELEQSTFARLYDECTRVNAHLQQFKNHKTPTEHDQQALQYVNRKNLLEQDLNRRVAVMMELRMKITEKFTHSHQLLVQVQNQVVDDELMRWKRGQQLAGNGVPFKSSIDQIQDWCEILTDLIWTIRKNINRVSSLKQELSLEPAGVVDVLPTILSEVTKLLSSLIMSTFIIEQQPPQVMKTNTRFNTTVRLLVGNKLDIVKLPVHVKVAIISETQANMLIMHDKMFKGGDSSGDISNNTCAMEYHHSSRQLSATFRNMQLKRIKRAEKKGSESVMDEKFALFYQSQFSIGDGELVFQVWTLSLPVVVIVHGNQEPNAWATVTWDNAFSEPGRTPFQVPDKVPWSKMRETLSQKFKQATGRGLSEENLEFLAEKAFRGNYSEAANYMLSWPQFCKEPLIDRNFTFWEWFFAVMKLTREHLRGPWMDGAIMGFVKKKEAEDMLASCLAGTFLLRFSDSELGGITIAFISGKLNHTKHNCAYLHAPSLIESQEVFSLQPFTTRDFQVRSLADRIGDLIHLTHLFPDTLKDFYFQKYYTPYQEQARQPNGYIKPTLVTQVLGLSHSYNATPQHTMYMSPNSIRNAAMSPNSIRNTTVSPNSIRNVAMSPNSISNTAISPNSIRNSAMSPNLIRNTPSVVSSYSGSTVSNSTRLSGGAAFVTIACLDSLDEDSYADIDLHDIIYK